MNPIWAALGIVGITLAVNLNKGLGWLRAVWPAFFGCPQCLGFQLGLLVGLLWLYQKNAWGVDRVMMSVLFGGATSLLSYLAYCVVQKLGAP